jgi:hypothetical protein
MLQEEKEFYTCLSKKAILDSEKYLKEISELIQAGVLRLEGKSGQNTEFIYLECSTVLNEETGQHTMVEQVIRKVIEVGYGISVRIKDTYPGGFTERDLMYYLKFSCMTVQVNDE